ncbi:universal stress protein [Hymenobacter caeli]|uniref:Nucleotide-binding universal stress UspA family protein n=1 Tax=Hymenobacter caeli TaxID=2735894 RepID=A0ABX2FQW1_9BACT|nr:universal stress protein [Hymenobacter caeli]NRT19572.1 nucleotide-binding universal stress UspA family protein [Hymenobacter caeli]
MNPSLLVLANLPEAAAHTARYAAALGQPLGLRLALLHCYLYPALLEPALVEAVAEQLDRNEAETMAALHALARRLPVPAEVAEAGGLLEDDVATAIRRYQPLLLAMGLGPNQGLLDELLRGQVLPVLRATGRPVLLVPAAATAPAPPRRVLVAADGEPFALAASSRALDELVKSWAAEYTVAHIDLSGELPGTKGPRALADVRASKLLPPATPLALYEVAGQAPAAGVLQAAADTQADLLVLIARPRSFLGALFHRSVTAEVLRHAPLPVLLLPAAG